MNPANALILAFWCTIGSTLGGVFGYFIGMKGGRPILKRFVTDEKITEIHNYFEKYEGWAIGIAGFTPIPYKVFTISAGLFAVNFKIFFLASILSRGARFFLVGGLLYFYGETIRPFLENNFDKLSLLMVALLFLGFFVLKIFTKKTSDSTQKDTEGNIAEKSS
jgi:membrane protein YqaA with SNARE-associated domain